MTKRSNHPYTLRPAVPEDIDQLAGLIQGLAKYEKLSDQVTGDPKRLERDLFGEDPFAHALVTEGDDRLLGFALYFFNYSTFLMKPGLYLEDLYVIPEYRAIGIGSAMMDHLAALAVDKDCGRFEWSVLDWNQPAIEFYQNQGAKLLSEWRICRLDGVNLDQRAQSRRRA